MRPCREVRIRCSSPSLDYIRLIRFSTGRLFLHLCLEDEENKYVLSCEIKNMWKIFLQFKAIGSRLASCLMNILVWKIKLYIQSSSSEEWEYAAVLHHGASRILILKTMICPWNFQNYMNGSQIIHVHIIQHLQDFFGYQQRSVLLHLWVLLCSVTSTWLYSWIFNTHTQKGKFRDIWMYPEAYRHIPQLWKKNKRRKKPKLQFSYLCNFQQKIWMAIIHPCWAISKKEPV